MVESKPRTPRGAKQKAALLTEDRVAKAAQTLMTAAACWNIGEFSGDGDKKVVSSLYAVVTAVEQLAARQRDFALRRVVAESYEAFWLFIAIERRVADPSGSGRPLDLTGLLCSTWAVPASTSGSTRAERVPVFIDSIWSDFLFAAGLQDEPLPASSRRTLVAELSRHAAGPLRGQIGVEEPATAAAEVVAELVTAAVTESARQGSPWSGIKTESNHLRDMMGALHREQVRADERARAAQGNERVAGIQSAPRADELPLAGRAFFNASSHRGVRLRMLLNAMLADLDNVPWRGYVFPHQTQRHWRLHPRPGGGLDLDCGFRPLGRRRAPAVEVPVGSRVEYSKAVRDIMGITRMLRDRETAREV